MADKSLYNALGIGLMLSGAYLYAKKNSSTTPPPNGGDGNGNGGGDTQPSTIPDFPVIKYGDSGGFVWGLQVLLRDCNFDPYALDGIFGLNTESALKAFQVSVSLADSGQADPPTWKALCTRVSLPLLAYGASGAYVFLLQSRLNQMEYDTGGVDGVFGSKTDQSVKQFQAQYNLAVDGLVGDNTWGKVLKLT